MADPPPPSGGRSKGRSRGWARPTAAPQDATRLGQPPPGVQQRQQQQQQPPPVGAAGTYPSASAGGRRNHRGVPRTETEAVTRGMAAMEMSGDPKGRGQAKDKEDYRNDNTRPAHISDKTGSAGKRIDVVANYFELLSKPKWVVFQYHVEFAPLVESPRVRRGLMASQKEVLGSCYLFDGMSDLKTITKMENEITEVFSQRKTDGETIRITLKYVAELAPSHPELGRLFNTQMRRNLQHLQYTLLGRHYFDSEGISEVPEYHLKIWQGVITSIRQQEESLMMLVDTVHKVVREDTALDIIRKIANQSQGDYKDTVAREIVGAIVMTRYNNRTYRVEDIVWDMNPQMKFETKEGETTYISYYKKQYDLNIRDLRQPLMLCTSKERVVRGGKQESKKIYLLPELCCMTGLTDQMRGDFTMMKRLDKHTKLGPPDRVRNLMHFIDKVNRNPTVQAEMKAWQLRFSKDLVSLTARVLPPESIIQGNSQYTFDVMRDFAHEVRSRPLHVARHLEEWLVISTKRDQNVASEFISTMFKVAKPMGMRIGEPKFIGIDGDRINNYVNALKENRTRRSALVVFIVPNDKKDRYDALKKAACIDFPIPSQVVIAKTLFKKQRVMSVVTKVAIQINCKLGGEAWALQIPLKMSLMVIGFDTYHDSSRKGRSAGGFVASLNSTFTQWYSRATFHQAGGWQELSDHLKVNLLEALKLYQSINKRLPSMILFYRDGVGDGQIRYVVEHEVKQFVQTINEVMDGGGPLSEMKTHYAFIVVNKRINTRFFERSDGRYRNPPPGTVVDSVVTRHDRYDYFLVSQNAKEGTVAPTMFNVIADRSGLKPEHMQRLSYKLTHLYFNFPGTIRVPAPCQYAHKLAFLCGQSLHREPSEALLQNLFYL